MKFLSAVLVTLALSTTAVADPSAADFEKFMTWFNGLTDQVTTDQNDCPKMASDINTSVAANKDMLDKAKANIQAGNKLSQDQVQRVQQTAMRFAQAVMAKCSKDKDVQTAMQSLPGRRHQ